MNLVAKEYVACRYDDDGALVLSEFAGAADELRQAWLVNPYDINGMKSALLEAYQADRRELDPADEGDAQDGHPSTTSPPGRATSSTGFARCRPTHGKQVRPARAKRDGERRARGSLARHGSVPKPDQVVAAAGNVAHKLLYGGLADLRPMPRTLIDEGTLREVYHYRPRRRSRSTATRCCW